MVKLSPPPLNDLIVPTSIVSTPRWQRWLSDVVKSINSIVDDLSVESSLSSEVLVANAVNLAVSNTTYNITSIKLTPGDWDVTGYIGFTPAATTSTTILQGGSTLVSATTDVSGMFRLTEPATVHASVCRFAFLPRQITVDEGTEQIVYLAADSTFTVSTIGAFGGIFARRAGSI